MRGAGELPSQSPSGDSSPRGGAKSRLPLWGALVPSGHRSALDRAGRRECPPKEGGEGNCATGRERRGEAPVSLAFSHALRAYKVKGKVETFLKKSFIKKLYARFARHSAARTSL